MNSETSLVFASAHYIEIQLSGITFGIEPVTETSKTEALIAVIFWLNGFLALYVFILYRELCLERFTPTCTIDERFFEHKIDRVPRAT